MSKRNKIILIIIIAFGWIVPCVSIGYTDVVIIVNKGNPVKTIKKSSLAKYFLKKTTRWETGIRVTPVDLKVNDPARVEFSNKVLKRSSNDVEKYWISECLTGGKLAPEIVSDSSLVKKRIIAEEGAVGYIDRTQIDETVKIVEIVN